MKIRRTICRNTCGISKGFIKWEETHKSVGKAKTFKNFYAEKTSAKVFVSCGCSSGLDPHETSSEHATKPPRIPADCFP